MLAQIEDVSQPRAVQRHLRRGLTKLVIIPASKANGLRPGGMMQINRSLGFTVRSVHQYVDIEHAFKNERAGDFLHRASVEQAVTYWKHRVNSKEAQGAVVVYEVVQ